MRSAIVVALLTVTLASPARAEPLPSEGTFFRFAIGAGRMRGRHSRQTQPPAIQDSFAFTSGSMEATVGWVVQRRWAFGFSLLQHVASYEIDPATNAPGSALPYINDGRDFVLATLGVTGEHHFFDRGGPFVGGTVGYSEFSQSIGKSAFGPTFTLQAGWDLPLATGRSAFGAALRLCYARLGSDRNGTGGTMEVFSPTVQLQYVFR